LDNHTKICDFFMFLFFLNKDPRDGVSKQQIYVLLLEFLKKYRPLCLCKVGVKYVVKLKKKYWCQIIITRSRPLARILLIRSYKQLKQRMLLWCYMWYQWTVMDAWWQKILTSAFCIISEIITSRKKVYIHVKYYSFFIFWEFEMRISGWLLI
jgi:hypothetical protein